MISSILMQLATSAPYLIVYAAGAILAARRMQRHPGPSRLALLACVVLFAGSLTARSLTGYFYYRALNHPEYESDSDFFAHYRWILWQSSFVAIVASVAGIGLLLKAVYAGREDAGREAMPEESAAPASSSAATPGAPIADDR